MSGGLQATSIAGEDFSSLGHLSPERQARALRILEEYLRQLEENGAADAQALLTGDPDLAGELRPYLAKLEELHQAAEGFRNAAAVVPLSNGERHAVDGGSSDGLPAGGLHPASRLGDYQLLREVGRGGMGVVYEAQQVSLQRRVALKVLPYAAVLDQRALQRFKNEALAAAQLDHPNIVGLYGIGCERSVHFYAMRFIDGPTLADCIRQLQLAERGGAGPRFQSLAEVVADSHSGNDLSPGAESAVRAAASVLPAADSSPDDTAPNAEAAAATRRSFHTPAFFRSVAELAAQVADALDHAHEQGVIHRDIKPSNLILDQQGKPYVADFGLARIGAETAMTATGDLLGTLRYMSPEQALARRVGVDHRTDIYSLGITLYELLALRAAFPGDHREELLRRIADDEPPALRMLNRAIPADLETIVLKAISKDPADRYATAADFAVDLRRYVDYKPVQAKRPGAVKRIGKWARRHRGIASTAAIGLLMTVSVLSASLGYTVRASAARRNLAEERAADALEEARESMDAGQWEEVLAAAKRAEAHLATADGLDELRTKANETLSDAALLLALDEAKARRVAPQFAEHLQRWLDCATDNAAAFRVRGLDLDAMPPGATAEWIASRPAKVRLALLGALHDWWALERKLSGEFSESPRRADSIGAALAIADRDPWRTRLRAALESQELGALLQLADEAGGSPQPVWAEIHLATTLCDRDDARETGIQMLRDAQHRDPTDFWLNVELHWFISRSDSADEERLRYAAIAVALRPNEPGARMNLALALYYQRRVNEAHAELRQLVRKNPNYAPARALLGEVLLDLGMTNEAIVEMNAATRLAPEYAPAHAMLGDALSDAGRFDAAVAACREALRLDPRNGNFFHALGRALWKSGRMDEAAVAYRAGIEIGEAATDTAACHDGLGLLLLQTGDIAGGIAALQLAVELNPSNWTAYNNLGDALLLDGQLEKGIAAHEKGVANAPDDPYPKSDLAWALATFAPIRNPARAVELATEAVKLAPAESDYHNTLGVSLYYAGDWPAAVAALGDSCRLSNGGTGYDFFFLAMAHWQLGHAAEAQSWLGRGIGWLDEQPGADAELLGFRTEAEQLLASAPLPVREDLLGTTAP